MMKITWIKNKLRFYKVTANQNQKIVKNLHFSKSKKHLKTPAIIQVIFFLHQ